MEYSEKSYLSRAVRHYRSLFSLPEYWTTILLILSIGVIGCLSSYVIVHQFQKGLIVSLLVFILPLNVTDIFLSYIITEGSVFFNHRRIAGISLFVCIILVFILNLSAVLQTVIQISLDLNNALLFAISLGFLLRFVVFVTVSQLDLWKTLLAIILQPSVQFISLVIISTMWTYQVLLAIIIPCVIFSIASFVFITLIDKKGKETIGIGAISLFKGFLNIWIGDIPDTLEEYFETLGMNSNIIVKLLAFKTRNRIQALLVVPLIHPGPFKNLGSSNLPYMIQKTLEDKNEIVVAVPHGTCGHELNLTSQKQCKKVIDYLVDLSNLSDFTNTATKLIRVKKGLAKASCQIFGDTAFLTLTFSPSNMEDVPIDIGLKIMMKGRNLGIKKVIVIDAHNSLNHKKELIVLSKQALEELLTAAEIAMKKALLKEKLPFDIGMAHVTPKEFNLKDGFGPGGIVVILVVIEHQKIAYVIIDGNNMISGLREEIIESLHDLVDDCEILTTDTHSVNAILPVDRGYYAVGEVGDKTVILSNIRNAVLQAFTTMDKAESSSIIKTIENIKILGEKNLRQISTLIDSIIEYVKKYAVLIYVPSLFSSLILFIIILFNG